MKKSVRIIISLITVLAIGVAFSVGAIYAYWGRNHKILYKVETVYVTEDEKENDLFHLKFECEAKNWFFNFKTYDCELYAAMEGEPSYSFKDENVPDLKLSNRGVAFEKECSLKLNIPNFDITKAEDKAVLEETIYSLDFIPRGKNEPLPFDELDARLFMQDNLEAEIVYTE